MAGRTGAGRAEERALEGLLVSLARSLACRRHPPPAARRRRRRPAQRRSNALDLCSPKGRDVKMSGLR